MQRKKKTAAAKRAPPSKSKKVKPGAAFRDRELRLMARTWLVQHARELDPDPGLEAEAIRFYEALERFDHAIMDRGYVGHIFAPIIVAYYGEDYVADHVIDELKNVTVNRGLFKQGDLLDRARDEGRREALAKSQ